MDRRKRQEQLLNEAAEVLRQSASARQVLQMARITDTPPAYLMASALRPTAGKAAAPAHAAAAPRNNFAFKDRESTADDRKDRPASQDPSMAAVTRNGLPVIPKGNRMEVPKNARQLIAETKMAGINAAIRPLEEIHAPAGKSKPGSATDNPLPTGYHWGEMNGKKMLVPDQKVYKPIDVSPNKHMAPSLYGINGADYARMMQDIDAYDPEDYNEFQTKYPNATFDAYLAFNPNAAAYYRAIDVLGEDAPQYAGKNASTYYARATSDAGATEDATQYYENYSQPMGIRLRGSDADRHSDVMTRFALGGENGIDAWDPLETGDTVMSREMKPEERRTFLALSDRYGVGVAMEYWDSLKKDTGANKTAYELREEGNVQFANEHPFVANAMSVALAPTQIASGIASVGQLFSSEEFDPYADHYTFDQMVQIPREVTASNIEQFWESKNDGEGSLWSFLMPRAYQAGMSWMDSMWFSTLFGGLSRGSTGKGATIALSSSAFSPTVRNVKMRGGNDLQALVSGAGAVGLEYMTEQIPMDRVLRRLESGDIKGAAQWVLELAKSHLEEGVGEGVSTLAQGWVDQLVMGDKSEFSAAVKAYERQGLSSAAAKTKATGDFVINVLDDVFVGGLSGDATFVLSSIRSGKLFATRTADIVPSDKSIANVTGEQVEKKTDPRLIEAAGELANERVGITPDSVAEPQQSRDMTAALRQEMQESAEAAQEAREQPKTGQKAAEEVAAERVEGAKSEAVKAALEAQKTIQDDSTEQDSVRRFESGYSASAKSNGEAMTIVGVAADQQGRGMLAVETADGKTDTLYVPEVEADSPVLYDLLRQPGASEMPAPALEAYIRGYDERIGTPEEYATGFGDVYRRSAIGMGYKDSSVDSLYAQRFLTPEAREGAYAAGVKALNAAERTQGAGNVMQQTDSNSPTPAAKGVMNRRFTKGAWNSMSRQQQRMAAANMEVVSRLAKRMGATINIVDSITDDEGHNANGRYNAKTGEIDIALNADANAYAYVAMHELTHKLKAEHRPRWNTFSRWVQEALADNGQDFEKLVKYQMDRFGLSRKDAAEEVICNTVPAILQDEGTLKKLYEQDRTLFEKLMNWLKNLIRDVKAAGKTLSERSESWKQMKALESDVDTLQGLYDVMVSIMQGERTGSRSTEQYRVSDSFEADKIGSIKYSYAGQTAKTADHDMLATARDMRDDGVGNETIRKETGWFVGKDGKWRFEMDDSQSRVKLPESNYNELGDLLENSKILEAYPEMANMKVIFQRLEDGQYGQYDAKFDTIDLAYELKTKPKELRYALLHELQHAIQHRERFATGASVAYWQRRIDEGFDTRTTKQKEAEVKAEEGLRRVLEEKPEFYHDMMNLRKMLPDVPRGKVDWDTFEQLEDDPIEWQEYDAQRDFLEDKYGVEAMFDFDDLLHDREKAMRSERSATDLYFATAGEIEARNVEERADLTAEERREKAPALGGEDTVFAKSKSWKNLSQNDTEGNTLKEQLQQNKDAINQMPVAAVIKTEGRKGKSDAMLTKEILSEFKATGYEVERQGFGIVHFGTREIDKAVHYANTDAEHAAILAAKKVVKRGIEINYRKNHKDRRYDSVTFAAPVIVNGKTGIVAVLVKKTKGNRFAVARILAPDGKAFVFQNITDAEFTTGGGRPMTEAMAVYTPINSASTESIAEGMKKVNSKFSLSDYDPFVREGENMLEELLPMTAAHRMSDAEARKIAKTALGSVDSKMPIADAMNRVKRILDYIARGKAISVKGLSQEMTALARDMLAQSSTLDEEHEAKVKPVREYLRSRRIVLSPAQREIAKELAGSYAAYRGEVFGYAKLTNDGEQLSDMWEDLSKLAPDLFPENTPEADQVSVLRDAVDALAPVYFNPYGFNSEEQTQALVNTLFDTMFATYMELPSVERTQGERQKYGITLKAYQALSKRYQSEHKKSFNAAMKKMQLEVFAADKKAENAVANAEAFKETLAEKNKEWRQKYRQGVEDTQRRRRYRDQIYSMTNKLLKKLEKPTDKKHIKSSLQKPIMDFLSSLRLGGNNKVASSLGNRISELQKRFSEAAAGGDSGRSVSDILDPDMIASMAVMSEELEGYSTLDQLSADELQDVRNMVRHAVHVVNMADQNFASNKRQTASERAESSLAEMSQRKDKKEKEGFLGAVDELIQNGMLDAVRFFDRLGPSSREVYEELRDGLDKKIKHIDEAKKHVVSLLKKYKVSPDIFKGKNAKKVPCRFGDKTLFLTRGQIMELYLLSKRPQGQQHLYGGGIRTKESVEPVKVTPEMIETTVSKLSEDERNFADELQHFLAKDCAKWGNETSLTLYGYEKFGEEHYYPIQVDKNSTNTMMSEEAAPENYYAVLNMGMTKALNEKATNALFVGDMFDTFSSHVDNMSTFAAYAAPIADLMRWINYKGEGGSVKTMLERKYGSGGQRYILNLVRSINGSVAKDYSPQIQEILIGKVKTAMVGANIRVASQQPTAIFHTRAVMNPKYLAQGAAATPKQIAAAVKLAEEYCPIAKWKSWGFFETHVGKNLRDMLFNSQRPIEKIKDLSMALAGKMDQITWAMLWRACEAETRAAFPGLEGEALYSLVGKRLAHVIDYTQVVDSPLHRTALMRSKNGYVQMATAFMSEPSKTWNMWQGVISAYAADRKNKAAQAAVFRMLGVFTVTGIANALAQSLSDAFRDNDEDETWLQKYGEALGGNVIDNLNPLNLLPYFKDVVSAFKGYSPSRLDTKSIESLQHIVDSGIKLWQGKNTASGWKWLKMSAEVISVTTGIPIGNAIREVYSIYNTGAMAFGGKPLPMQTETANTKSAYAALYGAWVTGDQKVWNRVTGKMEKWDNPKDEASIDTGLAQNLMTGDPRIADAYEAKERGDVAELNRLRGEISADYSNGVIPDSRVWEIVDKAILLYEAAENPAEVKPEEPRTLNAKLFTMEDGRNAVQSVVDGSGSLDDARLVVAELVADSGAKDPEKTVYGELKGHLKPQYIAAVKAGDTGKAGRIETVLTDLFGVEESDLDKWIVDDNAESARTAISSGDSESVTATVAAMREDGVPDSTIKSRINTTAKDLWKTHMLNGDVDEAKQLENLLIGLGLTGASGKPLYTEETFEGWAENLPEN